MYYYIKGNYVQSMEGVVVVDCGGIGYRIFVSAQTMQKLPPTGNEVLLYTHFYVREDAQTLYGFATSEEQGLFLQLLSVSGVGPKAALAILSVVTPGEFALAVISNQVKVITKAAGVGPRLAQRIILELRDKMKSFDALPEEVSDIPTGNVQKEAISALQVLGYAAQEAERAVASLPPELSVEDMVREALKRLMS